MRCLSLMLYLLTAVMLSACDFWPEELKPLADSISQQIGGETTAWRVGGDMVVINVANSPVYTAEPPELESLAAEIAAMAIAHSPGPLESIALTFHAGTVSEDAAKMREFIFLVMDNQPVLQPPFDVEASGPLTLQEIQARFIDDMDVPLTPERRQCVLDQVEQLAHRAGDPETLDPASVELLPAANWHQLDAFGKRLILAQAITTKALFVCSQPPNIQISTALRAA